MGNKVLLAVRHRELDDVAKLSLKEICYGVHRHDFIPKRFDDDGEVTIGERKYGWAFKNVIVSSYYHVSNSVLLYVDDQMMCSSWSLRYGVTGPESPGFDFPASIKGIKHHLDRTSGHMRRAKFSVLKRQGVVSRPKRTGEKISLFLLFTDCLDAVQENPHVMEDIVHYCQSGEERKRSLGSYGQGIKAIGTIEADQAGYVHLYEYQADIYTAPRTELQISEEEMAGIQEDLKTDNASKAYNNFEIYFTREIAASNGYLLKERPIQQKA